MEQSLDISDAARLFAIANLAAGDVASACHNDKYVWMRWRPITAIQEAADDGNDATEPDPDWVPLVDTPPYPEHPSGWNCYAGAHVGALREFFETDETQREAPRVDFSPGAGPAAPSVTPPAAPATQPADAPSDPPAS